MTETEKLQGLVRQSAADWVDDREALRELCRQCGVPEDEIQGDSYYVPGLVDLAELAVQYVRCQHAR